MYDMIKFPKGARENREKRKEIEIMKYTMNAWGKNSNGIVKFFENDEPASIEEKYFHVTVEGSWLDDMEAHFKCYEPAITLFKAMIEKLEIKSVNLSDNFLAWLTAEPNFDEEPTREEEYAEACMASEYGDESLMRRYERKYEIEEEYGPSNPWDAPGMKVSDFIHGVIG